ncbi:MAG: CDP-alcohol phosphatidyltransferase family protein [Bacteroidales bacterium]|nr:CDP-alcohol phosphatidyltransferase family protein [Bacteroidales bacterium]
MSIKRHIPNFLTLMNLLSGSLSVYFFSIGHLDWASYMIFIAAMFDFLDGFVARMLHVSSPLGVQLDSLADVVSFGLAPSFLLMQLIMDSHGRRSFMLFSVDIVPFLALLIVLFAALRLAKFNIDDRQTTRFLGLPTPAAGLMIASLPLLKMQLYEGQSLFYMLVTNTYFYLATILILCVLMVSEFPLLGLKFKTFGWRMNELRYIFLIASAILLVWLYWIAIPFILLLYLFISMVAFLADIQS